MVLATSPLVAVGGLIVIMVLTGLVYWDAQRVGFDRPRLWAGIVAVSMGIGLALHVFVGTVPIPGLLVIVLAGIVFYLFERDDVVRGEDPPDPHELPGGPPVDGRRGDNGAEEDSR
ncbi:hypothetical protein ACLI4R_19005 [Natrialbaceae archaeon A-chndr2]